MENKKKSNPWKRATIILALLLIFFSIESGYHIYKEISELEDLISPETMCSKIAGTPSWADYEGNILGSGFQNFNDTKLAVDLLINESIYLLYAEECYYCQMQIQILGEDWQRYEDSGLTIDCGEVGK